MLAAGSIGAVALAAVLGAGADGAWVGTAFVATEECVEVNDEYKRLIVASDGEIPCSRAYDIVSGAPWPTGIGERVRRNAFTDEWHQRDAEVEQTRRARAQLVHAGTDRRAILYGQAAGSFAQCAQRPTSCAKSVVTPNGCCGNVRNSFVVTRHRGLQTAIASSAMIPDDPTLATHRSCGVYSRSGLYRRRCVRRCIARLVASTLGDSLDPSSAAD